MNCNFDNALDHRFDNSFRWEQPEGRNDVIGMGTADLDFCCPPCVREATKRVAEENTFNYRKKPKSYFAAVLGWYERNYGLQMEKSWLSNVPSTIGAIHISLRVFARPGDAVIMQTPYFAPLKRAIEGAGCRLLDNPMILKNGRYELDIQDFERKIKEQRPSIFLMVNPQNPTGRAFTREELCALVDICYKYQVLIVSDEVHSLILYDDCRHIPVLAVSQKAREISIQVVSMSKGYNIMSLPHAIISIANPQLQERWKAAVAAYSFGYASNSFCIAAVTSIMSGEGEEWLRQLNAYLRRNRDEMIHFIKDKGFPMIPVVPEASFLLWADCRNWKRSSQDLAKIFLEEAGISLNSGTEFGEEGNGFVRINFAVTNENLHRALERMEAMFHR